jgi:prefoldin subunit 5
MTNFKIKDSKGNIYNSCPFIDMIIQFLDTQIENANAMKIELEKVRAINEQLRKESLGGDYKDKLKIVEDYLGVYFEGHWEKWFESNIKEIDNKIKELEKENQELKQELNNLTN